MFSRKKLQPHFHVSEIKFNHTCLKKQVAVGRLTSSYAYAATQHKFTNVTYQKTDLHSNYHQEPKFPSGPLPA